MIGLFIYLGFDLCTILFIIGFVIHQNNKAFFTPICNKTSSLWVKVKMMSDKKLEFKLKIKPYEFLIFAAVVITVPYLFTPFFSYTLDILQNEDLYKWAGALQGFAAPFSAGIAAILTFVAFWTQYSANKIIIEDNRKQETTRRFYEMLRIHKENVSELQFKIYSPKSYQCGKHEPFKDMPISERKGREIFSFYLKEMDFIYKFICFINSDPTPANPQTKKQNIVTAYNIFYKGQFRSPIEKKLLSAIGDAIFENEDDKTYFTTINNLIDTAPYSSTIKENIRSLSQNFWAKKLFFGKQKPFCGHFEFLNHYYRHLYLTVKLVAEDKDLTYPTKRNLLRILRAQLTNKEQLMLFYNWLSGNGNQWEAMQENVQKPNAILNNYFSRYRMIHNISPADAIFCDATDDKAKAMQFIDLLKSVCLENNLPPKMCKKPEFDYDNDLIFQFEEWYDKGTLGFTYPPNN